MDLKLCDEITVDLKKNHSGFEKHHGFKNDKSFYCTVIAYSFGILFESIFLPVHYTLFTL